MRVSRRKLDEGLPSARWVGNRCFLRQLLRRNVKRFRGGLVFQAHRLCVSLNSRLGSNKEEEENRRDRIRLGQRTCIPLLMLIDSCITQLKAQGPSRTCNESKEEGQRTCIPRGSAPTGAGTLATARRLRTWDRKRVFAQRPLSF